MHSSASVWRGSSNAALGDAVGYALPLARPNERAPLAQQPVVFAPRTMLFDPGRFAARLSLAARFAALGRARTTIHTCIRPIPTQDFAALCTVRRKFASGCARTSEAPTGCRDRRANRRTIRRPSLEPRSAPRRATASSTFSCPRRAPSMITSRSSRRWRSAANALRQPVIIEGYEPPCGSAPRQFQGHPRPRRHRGQCAAQCRAGKSSWRARPSLYETAHECRLRSEKFMLDGRHVGTGGGNHIVLGGATRRRFSVPAPARSAAQPHLAIGTTIRRCRICSRGCSSAPRRRRRASTRRATIPCTSSRSRSGNSRRPEVRYRRGSSIGCSEIC